MLLKDFKVVTGHAAFVNAEHGTALHLSCNRVPMHMPVSLSRLKLSSFSMCNGLHSGLTKVSLIDIIRHYGVA